MVVQITWLQCYQSWDWCVRKRTGLFTPFFLRNLKDYGADCKQDHMHEVINIRGRQLSFLFKKVCLSSLGVSHTVFGACLPLGSFQLFPTHLTSLPLLKNVSRPIMSKYSRICGLPLVHGGGTRVCSQRDCIPNSHLHTGVCLALDCVCFVRLLWGTMHSCS